MIKGGRREQKQKRNYMRLRKGYSFLESLPDDMPASLALLALAEKIADTLANTFGYKNMTKIYQMLLSGTAGTEAVKGYGRELYVLVYNILVKGLRSGEFTSFLPPETLSRHFIMAIRGVSYEWCIAILTSI